MLLTNWLMSLKHRFPRLVSRSARRRGRGLSRLSSLRRWDSPVQSCAAVELLEDRTLLSSDFSVGSAIGHVLGYAHDEQGHKTGLLASVADAGDSPDWDVMPIFLET